MQNVLPLDELDILFTPLVAFDKQGNRLGMGGGFMIVPYKIGEILLLSLWD